MKSVLSEVSGIERVMKKDKNALIYSRICSGKRYFYSVCENGKVIKCSRIHYVESAVKPYLKRGHATVKINQREYTLKNLVAKHFIECYCAGDYVEVLSDDPFDCAVWNLRLYTQSEHGRRTAPRVKSQGVVANGIEYESIRKCAAALHCSYQTVLDYLSGNVKHSVLRGIAITKMEGNQNERHIFFNQRV